MDEIFKALFTQQITTTGLLLFIIMSLMKGWLVPFWQIKEMKDKLKTYEEKAPELLKEVAKLVELQREENERARYEQQMPHDFMDRAKPRTVARRKKTPPRRGEDQ